MGVGLFIMSGITGLKVQEVFQGCVPYLLPLFVALLLVTYVPAVSLFLPDLLLPVR
jgi:C4-dicarboxylate transporter DctM subunit